MSQGLTVNQLRYTGPDLDKIMEKIMPVLPASDERPFLPQDEMKYLSNLGHHLNHLTGGEELDLVILVHDGDGHLLGEMRKREDYGYVFFPGDNS